MSANVGSDAHSRAEESLDARLLRWLLRTLGDPPIEFHLLWSDERVTPTSTGPLEHLRIADRCTLFGLLYDAQMRFGDAYTAGRVEVEGDLVKFMVALFQIFAPDARESTLSRIVGWCRSCRLPPARVRHCS
jgi:cyclopropane-fatty-acyl-phospholipid synthase